MGLYTLMMVLKDYKHFGIQEIESLYPYELEAFVAIIKDLDEKKKKKKTVL